MIHCLIDDFLITTLKYFDQINGSRTAKVTVSEEEPRKATNKGEAGGQQGGGKGGTTLHVLYLQGISTLCSSTLGFHICSVILLFTCVDADARYQVVWRALAKQTF